jgi:hypothetical protein
MDTVYVDIDDEITALIDKIKASDSKVVALVLPKRASVLQSIVNMKLLKLSADNDKKRVVLITGEAGLLPLAGAVGLYVAKSLGTKPEVPPGPNMALAGETETIDEDIKLPLADEEEEAPDLTKKVTTNTPVGVLADALPESINGPKHLRDVETLELDNEPEAAAVEASKEEPKGKKAKEPKLKKDKHLKVPNFNRFRWVLVGGILLIAALVVFGIFAFLVWPKATIDIKTNASNVNTTLQLTLDPQASSLNLSSGDIPANTASEQKTFSQTVNTTGQQNEGTAANGTVIMNAGACSGTVPNPVPAGTSLSSNSLTYITQQDATFSPATQGHNCSWESNSVQIAAANPGSNYNTANSATFTVTGFPSVTATGSATGGTDNIVQVVSQNDVNAATTKITSTDTSAIKQSLINQLRGQGLYPIEVTFAAGSPQVSANPTVGTASPTVTVTETISYTMYGVKKSDLNTALNANIKSQTANGQNILTNGLTQSGFKQLNASGTNDTVSLSALAVVGPNISVSKIKKDVAGRSPQAIISIIKNNPNVTTVTVRLSPFWVTRAPKNTAKIFIQVAKPSQSV